MLLAVVCCASDEREEEERVSVADVRGRAAYKGVVVEAWSRPDHSFASGAISQSETRIARHPKQVYLGHATQPK